MRTWEYEPKVARVAARRPRIVCRVLRARGPGDPAALLRDRPRNALVDQAPPLRSVGFAVRAGHGARRSRRADPAAAHRDRIALAVQPRVGDRAAGADGRRVGASAGDE